MATYDYHLLSSSLMIAIAVFVIGAVGLSVRRNLVVMFFSAAIMLLGVSLALCAFGSFHGDWTGRAVGWIVACLAAVFSPMIAAVAFSRFERRRSPVLEPSSNKARHD